MSHKVCFVCRKNPATLHHETYCEECERRKGDWRDEPVRSYTDPPPRGWKDWDQWTEGGQVLKQPRTMLRLSDREKGQGAETQPCE